MIEEDRGLQELREGTREVRDRFPNECSEWFGQAMTDTGYLGAFIPEEHGGTGLDPTAAFTNLILSSYAGELVLVMPRSV